MYRATNLSFDSPQSRLSPQVKGMLQFLADPCYKSRILGYKKIF